MSPKFLMAVTAACIAFAPCAMAQSDMKSGASGSPDASRPIKGSKSTTSFKEGQTGGTTGQQDGQTDRMGGGGGTGKGTRMGGGGGKSKDPAKAINLNSSRSNTY